jgi:plastocyanin
MSVIEKPEPDRIEDRLQELEREERELERRTDGYQWNHAIALIAAGVSLILALVAIVIAVNADNRTPVASTPTGMAGAMSGAMSSAGSGSAAAASSSAPAKSIALSMKPDAKRGPDGKTHDAVLPTADLTVKAGQTVRLTIYNYDDMPHSFTSPGLASGAAIPPSMQQLQGTPQDLKVMPMPGMGVDKTIPGGTDKAPSKTVIAFTAPSKPGTYIWYCRLPCDPFSMAHDGYMQGRVTVTSA